MWRQFVVQVVDLHREAELRRLAATASRPSCECRDARHAGSLGTAARAAMLDKIGGRFSARIDWFLFLLLGFMWGSSYLFIKIGVEAGLLPFTLIMLRLVIGFALLAVVVTIAREPLPRSARPYGHLMVMSIVNVVLPFALITWAEQTVDSSFAAILNAAVPLFVIVIAAAFLREERITLNRLAGLTVGFVGVAILVGFDAADVVGGNGLAELALIGSAVSYAISIVYARRYLHGLRPMIPAVFQVGFALVIVTALAFAFEDPMSVSLTAEALFAVVWLGLLGSGLAYLVYFRILSRWGATRTSLVAYLLPIFGIALGAVVLREAIDLRLLIGTAIVIGGVALVNSRRPPRLSFGRAVPLRRNDLQAPARAEVSAGECEP
jgi:drug/metabolite transporter (DMT)-like permease